MGNLYYWGYDPNWKRYTLDEFMKNLSPACQTKITTACSSQFRIEISFTHNNNKNLLGKVLTVEDGSSNTECDLSSNLIPTVKEINEKLDKIPEGHRDNGSDESIFYNIGGFLWQLHKDKMEYDHKAKLTHLGIPTDGFLYKIERTLCVFQYSDLVDFFTNRWLDMHYAKEFMKKRQWYIPKNKYVDDNIRVQDIVDNNYSDKLIVSKKNLVEADILDKQLYDNPYSGLEI